MDEKIVEGRVLSEFFKIRRGMEKWFLKYRESAKIDQEDRTRFSTCLWSVFPVKSDRGLPEIYRFFYELLERMLDPDKGEYNEEKLKFYSESGILYILSDVLWNNCKPDLWRLRIGTRAMRILDAMNEGRVSVTSALGSVVQINGLYKGYRARIRRLIFNYMDELFPGTFYYSLMNDMINQDDGKIILDHLEKVRIDRKGVVTDRESMSESAFEYLKERCRKYLTDPMCYSMYDEKGHLRNHFLGEEGCYSRIIPMVPNILHN